MSQFTQMTQGTISSRSSGTTMVPADSTQSNERFEVICEGCWRVNQAGDVVISSGCFKILCRSCYNKHEHECCHKCNFHEKTDADIPIEAKLDLMNASEKFKFVHNKIVEPLRQACEAEIKETEKLRSSKEDSKSVEIELKKQAAKLQKRSNTNKKLIEQYSKRAKAKQAELKEEMKNSNLNREEFESVKESIQEATMNSSFGRHNSDSSHSIIDKSLNGSFRLTGDLTDLTLNSTLNCTFQSDL